MSEADIRRARIMARIDAVLAKGPDVALENNAVYQAVKAGIERDAAKKARKAERKARKGKRELSGDKP